MFRVHAAVSHPKLFSALVLVDPVAAPPLIKEGMTWADSWGAFKALTVIIDSVVARRNVWGSRYAFCCSLLGRF